MTQIGGFALARALVVALLKYACNPQHGDEQRLVSLKKSNL